VWLTQRAIIDFEFLDWESLKVAAFLFPPLAFCLSFPTAGATKNQELPLPFSLSPPSKVQHPTSKIQLQRIRPLPERSPVALGYGGTRPGFPSKIQNP
jgi:hypothetical protein